MGEGRRRRLVVASTLGALLVAAPAAAENADARTELRWADERIDESSGLAFVEDLLVTTNDSGDDAVVYVVDPGTGATVGTTAYAVPDALAPTDVEALAPVPRRDAVWVADIGDNRRTRDTVVVHRVPIAAGDRSVAARSVVLAYPDGARDAETLLTDPRTGRLYVVTKGLLGGTVYAAPRDLSPHVADADGEPSSGEPGLLEEVGDVPGLLTDGLLLPRGAGVLLRDYAGSTAYTWPGLERITPVGLPAMRQGEAIALHDAGDGLRVWASTEGAGTRVVSVPLPAVLRARMDGRRPEQPASSAPPAPSEAGPGDGPTDGPAAPPPAYATEPATFPPWVAQGLPYAVVVLLVGGLATLLWRIGRRS